jgi:hypothetical protein
VLWAGMAVSQEHGQGMARDLNSMYTHCVDCNEADKFPKVDSPGWIGP